jgi:hypothetical protein
MDYSRQAAVFNNEKFNTPVTIIGAGATGSWTALFLAKMGIKDIRVYDFDIVEAHNIPNQLFGLADVGKPKVVALQDQIKALTGLDIHIYNERVDANTPLNGIIICLTDTMSSRKEIWESTAKYQPDVPLWLETRMGIDEIRLYEIAPCNLNHVKAYDKTMYSDDTAEVSACGTSMSVISTAAQLASQVAWSIIHYANGGEPRYEYLENYADRVSSSIQPKAKKKQEEFV